MRTTIWTFIAMLTFCSCKTQTFGLADKNLHSGQVYTTYSIFYSLGSDTVLLDISKQTLDSITDFLKANPDLRFEIGNHTDFRGDDNQNLILSQNRADKLRSYFISQGIDSDKLTSKGYGETRPLQSIKEQDKLGHHAKNVNRRVTLKIMK